VNQLPTFIDSSDLDDKSFSFYLHNNPELSYMYLPGFDEDAFEGMMTFHYVVEEKYWSLKFD
jgi:hypothetical protein